MLLLLLIMVIIETRKRENKRKTNLYNNTADFAGADNTSLLVSWSVHIGFRDIFIVSPRVSRLVIIQRDWGHM